MSHPRPALTLEQATAAYWQHRPAQSRPALTEHRLRQTRKRTDVQIWLRRAQA